MNNTPFDERELKEIQHSLYYAERLAHGTVGHNMLMLLAKLATAQGFNLTDSGYLFYEGKPAQTGGPGEQKDRAQGKD